MVLLATHNGETWLPEQLDSLLAQDHLALQFVVRDDASTDNTPALLEDFRERAPERVTLLPNPGTRPQGARANFAELMDHALNDRDEAYILFCDQDDSWHSDKVSALLAELPSKPGEPALVFSDMRVVDDSGKLIAESFMRYQHLSPHASLSRLLVQNHVSGCASLANRAALELAWPLPTAALMHDWWLALVSACVGTLCYREQPLQNYRQHEANAVGAAGYGTRYLWQRASGNRGTGLAALYEQAAALEARLTERDHPVPNGLASFLATRGMARLGRLRALLAAGHTRSGLVRNLPLWLETE